VLVAGLSISVVGALAGGFGFFAGEFLALDILVAAFQLETPCLGLEVTGDILLVLGVLQAIFDLIDGAIQRSKLRDAINSVRRTLFSSSPCLTVLPIAALPFALQSEVLPRANGSTW
jgi:hypothetical protein